VFTLSGLDGKPWSRPGNALPEDPQAASASRPPSLSLVAPSSCTLLSCVVLPERHTIRGCSGTTWLRLVMPRIASPSPPLGRTRGSAFSRRLPVLTAIGVVLRRQLLLQRGSSSGPPSPQVRTLRAGKPSSAATRSAIDSHLPGRSLVLLVFQLALCPFSLIHPLFPSFFALRSW